MNPRSVVVAVLLLVRIAAGGPPPLVPYKSGKVTVSFPKGWTVAQQSGMYVAQQDPKRSDAADLVFVDTAAGPQATEDKLLDALTAQLAPDFKASKRGPITAGAGHFVVGDATVGGVKVRIGGLAVVADGKATACVLVAKPGDFDALGGLALVGLVAASMQGDPAQGPATPPLPTTTTPASRTPTIADITGEWAEDAHADQAYADSRTGQYTGYYATITSTKMQFDGKGHFTLKGRYTIASSSGASGGKVDLAGTIAIKGNVLVYQQSNWNAPEYFYIRGWDVLPGLTRMKLNGHYNSEADALKAVDPHFATNLDTFWVHQTK